jgi:hypothetical protein
LKLSENEDEKRKKGKDERRMKSKMNDPKNNII